MKNTLKTKVRIIVGVEGLYSLTTHRPRVSSIDLDLHPLHHHWLLPYMKKNISKRGENQQSKHFMYNISIFIVWLGLFVPLPSLTYMKMLTAEDFNFWPILCIHKQCPLLGSTTHTNIAKRLACFTSWSTAVILEKNVYNKRTRQINVRTFFSWVKQFH